MFTITGNRNKLAETRGDSQRHAETCRELQRLAETHRDLQRLAETKDSKELNFRLEFCFQIINYIIKFGVTDEFLTWLDISTFNKNPSSCVHNRKTSMRRAFKLCNVLSSFVADGHASK